MSMYQYHTQNNNNNRNRDDSSSITTTTVSSSTNSPTSNMQFQADQDQLSELLQIHQQSLLPTENVQPNAHFINTSSKTYIEQLYNHNKTNIQSNTSQVLNSPSSLQHESLHHDDIMSEYLMFDETNRTLTSTTGSTSNDASPELDSGMIMIKNESVTLDELLNIDHLMTGNSVSTNIEVKKEQHDSFDDYLDQYIKMDMVDSELDQMDQSSDYTVIQQKQQQQPSTPSNGLRISHPQYSMPPKGSFSQTTHITSPKRNSSSVQFKEHDANYINEGPSKKVIKVKAASSSRSTKPATRTPAKTVKKVLSTTQMATAAAAAAISSQRVPVKVSSSPSLSSAAAITTMAFARNPSSSSITSTPPIKRNNPKSRAMTINSFQSTPQRSMASTIKHEHSSTPEGKIKVGTANNTIKKATPNTSGGRARARTLSFTSGNRPNHYVPIDYNSKITKNNNNNSPKFISFVFESTPKPNSNNRSSACSISSNSTISSNYSQSSIISNLSQTTNTNTTLHTSTSGQKQKSTPNLASLANPTFASQTTQFMVRPPPQMPITQEQQLQMHTPPNLLSSPISTSGYGQSVPSLQSPISSTVTSFSKLTTSCPAATTPKSMTSTFSVYPSSSSSLSSPVQQSLPDQGTPKFGTMMVGPSYSYGGGSGKNNEIKGKQSSFSSSPSCTQSKKVHSRQTSLSGNNFENKPSGANDNSNSSSSSGAYDLKYNADFQKSISKFSKDNIVPFEPKIYRNMNEGLMEFQLQVPFKKR